MTSTTKERGGARRARRRDTEGGLSAADTDGARGVAARDPLASVQLALSKLRGVNSLDRLFEKATCEVCQCLGFSRAILFRLDGSELVAQSVYFEGDPEWAAEIAALARREPPRLTPSLPESDAFRRRQPLLVLDAQAHPSVFKPIVGPIRTSSYVAAPILPGGDVIGYFHADRYGSGSEVDEIDRDTLRTFAEGFGFALERTALLERLRRQREQIRRTLSSAEVILDEISDVEVELTAPPSDDALASVAASVFVTSEARPEMLLSRREREVLELMARGATNAGIADRLVISEGTVKSHVKHILRKLRAANRAEAVSCFLRGGRGID